MCDAEMQEKMVSAWIKAATEWMDYKQEMKSAGKGTTSGE